MIEPKEKKAVPEAKKPAPAELLKDFSNEIRGIKRKPGLKKLTPIIIVLIIVGAGVLTGRLLAARKSGNGQPIAQNVEKEDITKGMTVGIADEKTFRDSAEGKLEKGGLNGEGSHHLLRPGGESQTVYLTSSIVDLDKFVGREIKVWGETFSAKKAGWLMDVGKVKVLN